MELSRRAATAGLASVVASTVVGCAAGSDPAVEDDAEPDLQLVRAALADELALLESCGSAARRHRELRRLLALPARVHRVHTDLLSRAVPGSGGGDPVLLRVPTDPAAALDAVVRAERALSKTQIRRALRADSGPLARALAAMAAAAVQQAHGLATTPLRGSRGAR